MQFPPGISPDYIDGACQTRVRRLRTALAGAAKLVCATQCDALRARLDERGTLSAGFTAIGAVRSIVDSVVHAGRKDFASARIQLRDAALTVGGVLSRCPQHRQAELESVIGCQRSLDAGRQQQRLLAECLYGGLISARGRHAHSLIQVKR